MKSLRATLWATRRTLLIRLAAASHDAAAAGLALVFGFHLRLGADAVAAQSGRTLAAALIFTCLAASTGMASGLNSGIWRYASLPDLKAIAITATASTAIFAAIMLALGWLDAPMRSVLVITWALHILILAGPRIAYRIWRDRRNIALTAPDGGLRGALLIGAGDAADLFVRSVASRPELNIRVLGIIDERERRIGRSIRGIPILGALDALPAILQRLSRSDLVPRVLILTRAREAFRAREFEQILDIASGHRLSLLRLPDPDETDPVRPRPVELQDLLQRPPVALDLARTRELVAGRLLLVTGAGGSIGSEICRQLLALRPRRLVLLDSSEYLLYRIKAELEPLARGTELDALLGDVRDGVALGRVFEQVRPELVFHAAALKHAPMVEAQPLEGFATNLLGTRNVADAARRVGVRAVVVISTDKAVNPTTVMGLSKRLAEMVCQTADREGGTQFVVVRFGNVLGSAGSVVPLFQAQLAAGGPLTVTHPEIERYFMTIPEAAALVLHAVTYAVTGRVERGRIFVLDMGKAVRIADLARRMIQLAGLRPDIDIPIAFIGLRPGEKMFEELFSAGEAVSQSDAPGVLVATPRVADAQPTRVMLEQLQVAIAGADVATAIEIARAFCPEYRPALIPARPAAATSEAAPSQSSNVVQLPATRQV